MYMAQPTLLPSLALALLYLTCLSLGFLMTAFLTVNGMTEVRGRPELLLATCCLSRVKLHSVLISAC